jgi:coxsackievirus/adenovirus receptor
MSLEAEERVNASTTDPNSTVEQSALTRDRVEDLVLERESQFREKQEEQARLLDELAGKLQSLDLSAAAEMVRIGVWPYFCDPLEGKTPTLSVICL